MPENVAEKEVEIAAPEVAPEAAPVEKPAMPEVEYNIWALIFKLVRFDNKFMRFLDAQSKKEEPPEMLKEPFYVGIFPNWPDFETMKRDYVEAVNGLWAAWKKRTEQVTVEKPKAAGGIHGLGAVEPVGMAILGIPLGKALVVVFVSIVGYLFLDKIEKIAKSPAAELKEAETRQIKEVRKTFGDKEAVKLVLKDIGQTTRTLARWGGFSAPGIAEKALDLKMLVLVASIAILVWKLKS